MYAKIFVISDIEIAIGVFFIEASNITIGFCCVMFLVREL